MTLPVLSIFGTRPEAIKMAPVVRVLSDEPAIESMVCVTAQHREMLDQVLELFGIQPDVDLDLMRPGQTLPELTARVLTGVDRALDQLKPDLVLVQGDTTTVMAAALAAFYRQIPVGHVEAGLRTHDRYNPFPEEINRRIAGQLASLHFAPTQRAADALLAEGAPAAGVHVTGSDVSKRVAGLSGEARSRLKVISGPRISDRALGRAVRASLAVLTPYRRVTQSGVVPVAFMHGVPVISTTAGSMPEFVSERETGALVPVDAPAEEWFAALDRVTAQRDELSGRCRSNFEAHFSPHQWHQVFPQLFGAL